MKPIVIILLNKKLFDFILNCYFNIEFIMYKPGILKEYQIVRLTLRYEYQIVLW